MRFALRNFTGGEISATLGGRADTSKYQAGLRVCRNFEVTRHGPVRNRSGTKYIGEIKDSTKKARLLKFVFNDAQTYVIEAGPLYFRFWQNGVALAVNAAPPTWNSATTYAPGDWAVDVVTGATFICRSASTNESPHLNAGFGQSWVSTDWATASTAYYVAGDLTQRSGIWYICVIADGTIGATGDPPVTPAQWYPLTNGIIEVPTLYDVTELFDVRTVQSADVVTIVHKNHAPQELCRTAIGTWKMRGIITSPATVPPANVTLNGSAGGVLTQYQVTAIDLASGAESLPGSAHTASPVSVSAVSWAGTQLAFTTGAPHGIASGTTVTMSGFTAVGRTSRTFNTALNSYVWTYTKGLVDLNGNRYILDSTGASTFVLRGVNSADYVQGTPTTGVVATVGAGGGAFAAPSSGSPITVSWDANSNAAQFNVYKAINGVYGFIGTSTGTSFIDNGITPSTSNTPPTDAKPFSVPSDYPATVAYLQQRLCFGDTYNKPEKVWMSRIGDFHNFTARSVLKSDDSFSFTPASGQVNEIRHMIDLSGKLLLLTRGAEWTVEGVSGGAVSALDVHLKKQGVYGSSNIAPIVIGTTALYVQARGSVIRDIQYSFQVDGYDGSDVTIYATHLFSGYTIVDWDFALIPNSTAWVVRSDGALLGLTYVREQQVAGWHRHDTTNGLFESVTVVPEGTEDVLYALVNRTIGGVTRRYIERFASRTISSIASDAWFVDCGTAYDGTNATSATMTLAKTGSTWGVNDTFTLTSTDAQFGVTRLVGDAVVLTVGTDTLTCTILSVTSSNIAVVRVSKDVPVAFQAVALTSWGWARRLLTGLSMLNGQTVKVLADGGTAPDGVVAAGAITLAAPAVKVRVGLPIVADLQTLDIETIQPQPLIGKKKRIVQADILAESSCGLFVGPDTTRLQQTKRLTSDGYGPPSAFTGLYRVNIAGSWSDNAQVCIRQTDPLPLTVLEIALMGEVGGG